MNDIQKARELLQLFIELKKLMERENENNWVQGVNLIINALTPRDYGGCGTADKAINYVETTYRDMVSGNGSFSDYFIWRDDFDERKNANKILDKLKNNIWSLINS